MFSDAPAQASMHKKRGKNFNFVISSRCISEVNDARKFWYSNIAACRRSEHAHATFLTLTLVRDNSAFINYPTGYVMPCFKIIIKKTLHPSFSGAPLEHTLGSWVEEDKLNKTLLSVDNHSLFKQAQTHLNGISQVVLVGI